MPARDEVATTFAHCLTMMACHWSVLNVPRGHTLKVYHSKGTLIANQRQDLAKTAIGEGATHVLWLDTDMRFPKDTLCRLLAHDKPIVAASYATRRIPCKTVAFANDHDWTNVYTSPESTGLEKVAAVGMGCMLVKAEVFQKMPKPYFAIGYNAKAESFVGEDIYFCRKAREMGHEVLIDHDLSKEVWHLGEFEFGHEHAWMEKKSMTEEPSDGLIHV